jgi:hypothetical protein
MDQPQVQISGPEKPDSNANMTSIEVEMDGIQDTVNDTMNDTANPDSIAPLEQSKATPAAPEGATLPDAQPDIEPLTPAKKNAGFKFLE